MQSVKPMSWPNASLVALLAAGVVVSGCGDDKGKSPAASAGKVSYTVPADGGSVSVKLASGNELSLQFPASAGGKAITLTPRTSASIGWTDGRFTDVLELSPSGTKFADPVRVRSKNRDLMVISVPNASGNKARPELLPLAEDGKSLELTHFSAIAVVPVLFSCDDESGWQAEPGSADCEDAGGSTVKLTFECSAPAYCFDIEASCCVAPSQSSGGCRLGDRHLSYRVEPTASSVADYPWCSVTPDQQGAGGEAGSAAGGSTSSGGRSNTGGSAALGGAVDSGGGSQAGRGEDPSAGRDGGAEPPTGGTGGGGPTPAGGVAGVPTTPNAGTGASMGGAAGAAGGAGMPAAAGAPSAAGTAGLPAGGTGGTGGAGGAGDALTCGAPACSWSTAGCGCDRPSSDGVPRVLACSGGTCTCTVNGSVTQTWTQTFTSPETCDQSPSNGFQSTTAYIMDKYCGCNPIQGTGGTSGTGGVPSLGGAGWAGAAGAAGTAGSAGMTAGSAGMAGAAGAAGQGGSTATPEPTSSCDGGLSCNGESCCTQIQIPGGTMLMGRGTETCTGCVDGCPPADTACTGGDLPEHSATVTAFRLDKYEVTVGRMRKFVAAFGTWRGAGHPEVNEGAHPQIADSGWQTGWDLSSNASNLVLGFACNASYATWTADAGENENYPMNCVNWFEAMAFCIWDGGWLPTEAEWEFAAASGDENLLYPWGEAPLDDTRANYEFSANTPFLTVGSYPAGNGLWGNADLSGSVFEWTLDSYESNWYAGGGATCNDCANLSSVGTRSVRGSSWSDPDSGGNLRSAFRTSTRNGSVYRGTDGGFRCARVSE